MIYCTRKELTDAVTSVICDYNRAQQKVKSNNFILVKHGFL